MQQALFRKIIQAFTVSLKIDTDWKAQESSKSFLLGISSLHGYQGRVTAPADSAIAPAPRNRTHKVSSQPLTRKTLRIFFSDSIRTFRSLLFHKRCLSGKKQTSSSPVFHWTVLQQGNPTKYLVKNTNNKTGKEFEP